MSKPDTPAFPVSVRKAENYMDEGGYGRSRTITVNEGGMSLRQYAAIHLRVPDSGEVWLDEMIERARRDEFAKAAQKVREHD